MHAIDCFVDERLGIGFKVCPLDETLLTTRVAFTAIKSAKEKRIVKLEKI